MLYLDYILYIIIIILLYIFVNRIINTNDDGKTKEGFEHEGKGKVSVTQGRPSEIEYAEYVYFDKATFSTKNMDVKSILDQLIVKKTDSIIVGPEAFGLFENDQSAEYDYLVIKFKNPYTQVKDGNTEANDGVWWWSKGDSVSLKFGNGSPDPTWFKIVKALYKVADLLAILILDNPNKMISNIVTLNLFGFSLPNFAAKIGDVIKKFIKNLIKVAKNIFKKVFGWVKTAFKKIVSILKDLPGFLSGIFDYIINFIITAVDKTFALIERLFKSVVKIIKTIINLPLKIFDILGKLVDIIINLFIMIINLPITILNMIIAFQEIGMDIMNKTPTIPFLNMFFQ
jgi:phage-related protein